MSKELTDKDYEIIGRYIAGQCILYINAIHKHSEMIQERFENEKAIHEAEINHDDVKLNQLYKEFREIKSGLEANRSFRQKLCDKILSNVYQVTNPEEYQNPIKIENLIDE